MKNKWIWVGGVVIAGFLFRHQVAKVGIRAPSQEEFFSNNPGLSPPAGMYAEKEPVRSKDELLVHDYHLLPDRLVTLSFEQESYASQSKKQILNEKTSGTLSFHGYQFQNGKLQVFAKLKILNLQLEQKVDGLRVSLGLPAKSPNGKLNDFQKQLAKRTTLLNSSVLIQIAPSGKIEKAFIPEPIKGFEPDLIAGAMFELEVIQEVLRKLPQATSGTTRIVQRNLMGEVNEMPFSIENSGDLRTIKSEQVTDSKEVKNTDPRFGTLVIRFQGNELDKNIWRIKDGLPESQEIKSQVDVTYQTTPITTMRHSLTSHWSEYKTEKFDSELAALFKTELDLAQLGKRKRDRLELITKKDQSKKGSKDQFSKHLTWDQARSKIVSANDSKMSEDERNQILIGYSDALKRDPSLVARAREDLKAAAPGSREMSMLMGALGFAGSPEAQAALVDVYNRSDLKHEDREKVLSELTLPVEALTPETKTFLKDTYQNGKDAELSKMSSFALGSSIAKDGDPETVTLFKKKWQDSYGIITDGSNEDEKKRALLLAMGNSKSNSFLSEVREGMNSPSPDVRSAAVEANRFNADDASRTLLFNSLKSEPNSAVRETAARSLQYQPFDARTVMEGIKCATSDVAISVKLECYHFLADNVASPEIRQFLKTQLGSEKDSRVLEVLENALQVTEEKH
jgi:hypothetical protein